MRGRHPQSHRGMWTSAAVHTGHGGRTSGPQPNPLTRRPMVRRGKRSSSLSGGFRMLSARSCTALRTQQQAAAGRDPHSGRSRPSLRGRAATARPARLSSRSVPTARAGLSRSSARVARLRAPAPAPSSRREERAVAEEEHRFRAASALAQRPLLPLSALAVRAVAGATPLTLPGARDPPLGLGPRQHIDRRIERPEPAFWLHGRATSTEERRPSGGGTRCSHPGGCAQLPNIVPDQARMPGGAERGQRPVRRPAGYG